LKKYNVYICLSICLLLAAKMGDNGDFGIEGISHFGNLRKEKLSGADDTTKTKVPDDLLYSSTITEGFNRKMVDAGYPKIFYYLDEDVWEIDLRSVDAYGGSDDYGADDVDLFFIITHGGSYEDGKGFTLSYDSDIEDFYAFSEDWKLGDRDLEWLAIHSCTGIGKHGKNIWENYSNIFNGLHLLLASYDKMYNSYYEVGMNFADNLLDGDTVSAAWLDGMGINNNPIVLSSEQKSTWNGGMVDWRNTTMNRDKYHGRGETVSDIDNPFWLGIRALVRK
jgi:hypothetical protein